MATGTVKWFNESKGFGYITPDADGPDLLAPSSEIEGSFKSLRDGQRVAFEVKDGPNGPQATAIKPA
jgi:CspA family cold shock protein